MRVFENVRKAHCAVHKISAWKLYEAGFGGSLLDKGFFIVGSMRYIFSLLRILLNYLDET
jgi:hypothetical protein